MNNGTTRILGIDPGLRITGYGCIEGTPDNPALIEAGVIRLVRGSGPTPSVASRLVELEQDLLDLIDRTRPSVLAVEAVFAHSVHPATAITMGHTRGVVLLVAQRANLDIVELAPKSIKQAMTGSGRASKQQMQFAVQTVFNLPEPPTPADVADALAIALAGSVRPRSIQNPSAHCK